MVEVRIGEGAVEVYTFEAFEARVTDGRIPATAEIRFEPVTGDRFQVAGELDLYRSLREEGVVAWRARFRDSGPPVLTALLVGLQVRIWLWAQLEPTRDGLVDGGVNWMSPALENGEPWRILTSGLLHADLLHILLNMVWMAYTGWNIERALGRVNLAVIFFFSVFGGGILSMFLTPQVPSLGASGGVYGLVSASVVFGFIRQDLLPEKGRRLFGAALAPYLVLMFLSGLSNPGTDNWAHFGGLVTGGVLAFLLDPPGFERQRLRNRLIQGGGTVAMAVILLGLGLAGPRVHPLLDHERARLAGLPATSRARALQDTGLFLTDLSFSVPAGWRVGATSAGDSGFISPASGNDRAVAVLQREGETPVDLEEAREIWKRKLTRGHPEARFEDGAGAPWLGYDEVLECRASLPDGQVLLWRGVARGVYLLYRVREFEADMERRLEPLFDRIDASIVWREPLELQTARRNHLATPKGVKARTELAIALAKWGEVEASLELLAGLVAERPEDPERWVGWLQIAARHPEASGVDGLITRALREMPEPVVLVEVARVLRERGEADAADGLLQLAWLRTPGSRVLRRALRTAGLRWTLDPTGLPAQIAWLPGGERRDDAAIQGLLELPLTLDAALRLRKQLVSERSAVAATFDAVWGEGDPQAAVDLLYRIRDGGFERAFDTDRQLRRDLRSLERGDAQPWMPPELVQSLTAERIQALLDATEPRSDPAE